MIEMNYVRRNSASKSTMGIRDAVMDVDGNIHKEYRHHVLQGTNARKVYKNLRLGHKYKSGGQSLKYDLCVETCNGRFEDRLRYGYELLNDGEE